MSVGVGVYMCVCACVCGNTFGSINANVTVYIYERTVEVNEVTEWLEPLTRVHSVIKRIKRNPNFT